MIQRYEIPHPAMGAVRQVNSDKWKPRDKVLLYRAWRDLLRLSIPNPPAAETTEVVEVVAWYAMPKSWSNKKRTEMIGQRKRTVPDPDNIWKGVTDALWTKDQALGKCVCDRRWGTADITIITIEVITPTKGA